MANFLSLLSKLSVAKTAPTQRAGVSGSAIFGGYVENNEKNASLSDTQKYKTFSDILVNVSVVGAGVRYFLNVIAKSSWKVEPADDTPEAKELAEAMESMLEDMNTPWHRIIRKGVMYKFYGFGVQEWIAKKRDDGMIGIMDIEARPQRTIERWDVDEAGIVRGMFQRSPQNGRELYLPRSKVIYIVDDSLNDSPDGLGLFRHLVEPAKRLQRYEQLEGIGYETDLRGIPVGRAPYNELKKAVEEGAITKEQMAEIIKPMKDFIENHIKGPKLGLLIDSSTYQSTNEASTPSIVKQWDVDLLDGGGGEPLAAVASSINRVSGEIARILGVEGLLLGQGKGSQALSRDKSDNFFLVVDSALTELADNYTHDLINTIWLLNGWPMDLKPWFKTDALQLRDVEKITGSLRDMAQAGAILAPDDPAIGEVRDLLGLSRPSANSMVMPEDNPDDKTNEGDE